MLADLSSIALEWAKNYVRQRQTFKLNTKGENMAPLAFQHDPDGTYHDLAVQLRNVDVSIAREDDGPSFEPMEDGEEVNETSAESKTPAAPTREKKSLTESSRAGITSASRIRMPSPEREGEKIFRTQKKLLSLWIDDPDHIAEETCRYALELYIQLNDSEFAYVTELQVIYDETRCFFLQWLLGKKRKELVNSARISAVQSGKSFTWIHARAEVLKSMTDVTLTARFLALLPQAHAGNDSKVMDFASTHQESTFGGPQATRPYPITRVSLPRDPRRPNVDTGNHGLRPLPGHWRRPITKNSFGSTKIHVR
jgi:hypothetical protein